jgi:hypothetical protein
MSWKDPLLHVLTRSLSVSVKKHVSKRPNWYIHTLPLVISIVVASAVAEKSANMTQAASTSFDIEPPESEE